MKILLTADLHYRLPWFQWLIDQSPKYDLVCVAGDFLDIFHTEPRMNQAQAVSALVRELAQRTRVAVCSGNHDDAGRLVTADRAPVYEWFGRLGDHPKITTDGSTQVIDNLIVTTIHTILQVQRKRSGLIAGVQSVSSVVVSGCSFITCRQASARKFPVKNVRPLEFWLLTSQIIFLPGISINSRTSTETSPLKGSTGRL